MVHVVNFSLSLLSVCLHVQDARWFTREEVASAKELYATATQNPGERSSTDAEEALSIPGPYAIAHHLIKHWLNNPPRHRL